jgi:hypothetical protein
MRLKELRCDDFQRERDAALLRSLTTLQKIHPVPPPGRANGGLM